MARSKQILIGVIIAVFVGLIAFPLWIQQHYLVFSLLLMGASFIPFMIRFSHQKITSRELVMLAILGAIASVSRIPFASLPSIQPSTFVVIVSGMVLGPQSGFVIGTLTALVSNLFLGQGPWTPWQMFAWGMIGLFAGLLRNGWVMKNMVGRCMYGFVVGIAFGWMMNLWVIIGLGLTFSWEVILLYYTSSFAFDLAHALSNVFFILLFSNSWIKILNRFKIKYGLFPTIL